MSVKTLIVQMLIEEYKNNMVAHKKAKEDLKSQYLSIINNKSIDLDIRWETFVEAAHEFKNHEGFVQHFVVLDQKFKNFSWYDDMDLDRYQTMSGENIISRIEDSLDDHKDGYENSLSKQFTDNPEWLSELKEEILQKNLGSFENDW